MMPLEALACGSQQQVAAATSGPAGAVYNVGKVTSRSWAIEPTSPCTHDRTPTEAATNAAKPDCSLCIVASGAKQATNIKFHDGMVPRETKEELLGQKGVVLWFTGAAAAHSTSAFSWVNGSALLRGGPPQVLQG